MRSSTSNEKTTPEESPLKKVKEVNVISTPDNTENISDLTVIQIYKKRK